MAEFANYEQQTYDAANPLVRFAHRRRFARSMQAVQHLGQGASIFDYGCGQGRFLSHLNEQRPGYYILAGFDPFQAQKYSGYTVVSDPNLVQDASVDFMTCLEVCEHLDEAETESFIEFAARKIKPGGELLVTVPIMKGPIVLLKEANRCVLYRRGPEYTVKELVSTMLFATVPPRTTKIKTSHKGYDFEETITKIGSKFGAAKVTYSPFPFLGWVANSQVFMTFQRPT
jgi:2-polyprenyl-3-methyl-5-hydroxy-6-metoxy-1,4-benzoquinol methylase